MYPTVWGFSSRREEEPGRCTSTRQSETSAPEIWKDLAQWTSDCLRCQGATGPLFPMPGQWWLLSLWLMNKQFSVFSSVNCGLKAAVLWSPTSCGDAKLVVKWGWQTVFLGLWIFVSPVTTVGQDWRQLLYKGEKNLTLIWDFQLFCAGGSHQNKWLFLSASS